MVNNRINYSSITSLMRYSKRNDDTLGVIDDLSIDYDPDGRELSN